MNELDMIKLNIFEAYDNGELSYGEKEYLLEQVGLMYEAQQTKGQLKTANNPYTGQPHSAKDSIFNNMTQEELAKNGVVVDRNIQNKVKDSQIKFNRYANASAGSRKQIAGGVAGAALAAGAIGAGAVALKRKYDNSVNGLMKKQAKLEAELAAATDPAQKKVIKAQIALVKKSIKELEAKSDRTMKESAFDLLLEEVNDLYYEDAYDAYDADEEYDY